MGVGVNAISSRFTPWKDPLPIVQEAGWASGPVWTGAEKLAPTGFSCVAKENKIRSPHTVSGRMVGEI
jgi:hypothetical protein